MRFRHGSARPADGQEPPLTRSECTLHALGALAHVFDGELREPGPELEERLFDGQEFDEEAVEDLLVQRGQSADRCEHPVASDLTPVPVEAQIARDGTEPGGETRRAVWSEPPQPPKVVATQLLADEEVAVANRVLVAFEQADDFEQNGRIALEESGPRFLRSGRAELIQQVCDPRIVHGRSGVAARGCCDAETPR